MTIRAKTWLLVLTIVLVLAISLATIARMVVLEGFATLEQDFALRNLKRAASVVQRSLEELNTSTGDYSSWDNTYEFVREPNQAFRDENFVASSFANLRINCMLLFDSSGGIVDGACFKTSEDETYGEADSALTNAISALDILEQPDSSEGRFGIIRINERPLMLAARPVLRNDRGGPSNGTLVFVRSIDSTELTRLGETVGLPLAIRPADSPGLEPHVREQVKNGQNYSTHIIDDSTQSGHALVNDIAGRAAFVLSCVDNRAIHAHGVRTYRFGLAWIVAMVVLFTGLILFLLEAGMLSRLAWLKRSIEIIKQKADPAHRIGVIGKDEVSGLALDINSMLSSLEEAKLRAASSEQRYRVLFEQMLNGFAFHRMIFDENGSAVDYIFEEINPAFERMTGLKREAAIGKRVRELMPAIEPRWIERYGRVVTEGNAVHFEDHVEALNRHYEVMAFRADDSHFGATFTDITERKKAEAEREEVREQLAQMQKMEAIGQLAGGIAHDFNNQMTGVLGYADMLRERLESDPKLSRFVNNMIVGIHRASDLTAQLLAFARKGKYRSLPVNMHAVILEVVNLLEHTIDKKIRISQKFNARPPVTNGDPTQLQNVILNTAINARDAMPAGGELIFATDLVTLDDEFCTKHPHEILPGRFIRVSVTDTGIGMNKETAARVFEPFFTTKPRGKGTGMGLAAAYGTVKNHHGAITVYSELGRGTTFNVYLPAGAETQTDTLEETHIGRIPGQPHILVVDDEPLVAEMAVDMLGELGCQVTHCDNGREAIEFYRQSWRGVDLVILDMIMPELNGRETFNQLLKINPHIRALLSSGYSLNGEAQAAIHEGILAFVQKPYHRSELATAVVNALKKTHSDSEAVNE